MVLSLKNEIVSLSICIVSVPKILCKKCSHPTQLFQVHERSTADGFHIHRKFDYG
jgi:hypothetical protein